MTNFLASSPSIKACCLPERSNSLVHPMAKGLNEGHAFYAHVYGNYNQISTRLMTSIPMCLAAVAIKRRPGRNTSARAGMPACPHVRSHALRIDKGATHALNSSRFFRLHRRLMSGTAAATAAMASASAHTHTHTSWGLEKLQP
jgi:hypothetical protein